MEQTGAISLIQIDQNKQTIKEESITRPESYEDLIKSIKENFKINRFIIYYFDNKDNEINIKSENEFKNCGNLIFVKEIKVMNKSIFPNIYPILKESKQDEVDEKYTCNICYNKLTENPYYCYQCQKRFCKKCFEDLSKAKEILQCPFCSYQLQSEKWCTLKNFIGDKNEILGLLEQNIILNGEISINKKKVEEYLRQNRLLNDHLTKANEKIKNNEELLSESQHLNGRNTELNEDKKKLSVQLIELKNEIEDLTFSLERSEKTRKELKQNNDNLIKQIMKLNDERIKQSELILQKNLEIMKLKEEIKNLNDKLKNVSKEIVSTDRSDESIIKCKTFIRKPQTPITIEIEDLNESDEEKDDNYFIYDVKEKYIDKNGYVKILGEDFVKKNQRKGKLIINGCKLNYLVSKYKLKVGINKIIIKLDKDAKDFSYLFFKCKSLKEISPLKNWDTSNNINFSYMFFDCESLEDISPIENWDVKKGNNFSYLFHSCKNLKSISSIKRWDVSKGNNFSWMFAYCESLSDISAIKNWNIKNGNNFYSIFRGLKITPNDVVDCLQSINSNLKEYN